MINIKEYLDIVNKKASRYLMARMKFILSKSSKYPTNNYDLWKDSKIKTSTANNSMTIEVDMPIRAGAIESGREPGEKKIPIRAIMDFIKKRNISPAGGSLTGLAFAIQTSIFKKGIKPRKFISESVEDTEAMILEILTNDKFADMLAEELLKTVKVNIEEK